MGHMHPRDVHRAASIINHPAWKASDCKLSGVTIRFEFWQLTEPAICNRLGKAGATFPTPNDRRQQDETNMAESKNKTDLVRFSTPKSF